MKRDSAVLPQVPFSGRFYLTAALALAVVAVVFVYSASHYVTEQTLGGAVMHASAHAREIQDDYLNLTAHTWRRTLKGWRSHNILATKIWGLDGRVLYSSDPAMAGKQFEVDKDLSQAANGRPVFNVGAADRPENRMNTLRHLDAIEIYVPIVVNERVVAVNEIYFSAMPLKTKMRQVSAVIWGGNIVAFVLLFLLLSQTVRTASNKLKAQQSSLQKALDELGEHYLATVESLNLALQSRDNYTGGHSDRVSTLAVAIGEELQMTPAEIEALRIGTLVHDVGKIGISDSILLKPGSLNEDEFATIMEHPVIGAEILGPLPSVRAGLAVVRHHHEKWDGTGYPDGLKGDEIELIARIAAYADIYDALLTDRPYRRAMSREEALSTIHTMVGSNLDPSLAPEALRVLTAYEGSPTAPSAPP